MKIDEFLKINNLKPTPWAKANGIIPELLLRFISGKRGLSLPTAAKIVAATGGAVGFHDLLSTPADDSLPTRVAQHA